MKRVEKNMNGNFIKRIFTGAAVLMMVMGVSAFGAEQTNTNKHKKAHEVEARLIQKQASENGIKIISREEAESIALKAAELDRNQVKRIRTELDQDDDYVNGERIIQYIYEIDFKNDGLEYEFEIDGETGKVLKSEVDSWFD